MSLETKTQGVDVVLKVTGPIDNMKLSYTSDPPLQFQEIVNLLATGSHSYVGSHAAREFARSFRLRTFSRWGNRPSWDARSRIR